MRMSYYILTDPKSGFWPIFGPFPDPGFNVTGVNNGLKIGPKIGLFLGLLFEPVAEWDTKRGH